MRRIIAHRPLTEMWHTYPQMFQQTLTTLLDLLLPHRCFGCRRSGAALCATCTAARELANSLDAPTTYALFAYRDSVIRRMIWALKYRGGQAVGVALGTLLGDYLTEELAETSVWGGNDKDFLVVPIPLSPARLRARGYNQATAIARGIIVRGGNNFKLAEKIIRRIRDTGSQTEIKTRAKRLANIRGAFAVVDATAVRGKQIILVDDVLTTGGTMTEARRALERAGAKIVIAAVVAHG